VPVALDGVGFAAGAAAEDAWEAVVGAGAVAAAAAAVVGAAVAAAAGADVGAWVGAAALVAAGAVVGEAAGADWEHAADSSAAPIPSEPTRTRRRVVRTSAIP